MNVDYFDKDLINEPQKITIKSKELIEDFYEKNINFWKHDIYKYENYKNIFKLKNIKEICFSTWNLIDFDISLIFLVLVFLYMLFQMMLSNG